jgi:hypothetical protein
MKRSIKMQVEESVEEEIKKLKLEGHCYLRFKDLEFCTDEYYFKGNEGSKFLGWPCYELKVAWSYLRDNFDYGRFDFPGHHANAKFFLL